MVTYTNRDFMTTLSASDVALGIKDGVDNIHSGIIKVLENAARGNYILDYNTASFTQLAGSTRTSFAFSAAINYMRDGVVTSANPASVELASDPDANNTRYDMIVIDSGTNALACRTGTASSTPRVIDSLSVGDIPVALVEVLAGASDRNVYNRKVQLYGYNKETNAVSVAYSDSSTYTETLTISGGATGSTIANLVADLSLTSVDDVTIQLGGADANAVFSITDNAGTPETQFSVDGAGTVKVPSLTASEIVISDASNNLVSAAVATYPSLTELTYVKGVSSAIQTQLDSKAVLTGSTNNTITTVTGANAITGEANLTFDGSALAVVGSVSATTTATATLGLSTGGTFSQGYELLSAALPAPTGTKAVIYCHDLSATGNAIILPAPVSGNTYYIKNLFANPLTITCPPFTIDLGDITHSYITAPNTITLAPFTAVTLQGTNDSLSPLTTGWLLIGTA